MNRKVIVGILLAALVLMTFAVAACGSETTTTTAGGGAVTTAAGPATTSGPTETSAAPATTAPAATKSLKVGVLSNSGWAIGITIRDWMQLLAENSNNAGGLQIGPDKYNVEIVYADSGGTQQGETAAANKLIFEDKVSFIVTEGMFLAGWQQISEENKVVVICNSPLPTILLPQFKYTFEGGFTSTKDTGPIGWFAATYPDKKNWIEAIPDTQMGHAVAQMFHAPTFAAFGITIGAEFFPEGTQDLSALATKIKNQNPDVFYPGGGGPQVAGQLITALYNAGYEGMFFTHDPAPAIAQVASAESLEGVIGGAGATDFEEPATQKAKDYIALYTAKYGKWDAPDMFGAYFWDLLAAGLQAAGSIDSTVVADAMAAGISYETVEGESQTIQRLDLGNTRCVDVACAAYIQQVKDGKPALLATIPLDEAMAYITKAQSAAPAGPPPGAPEGATGH